jgi:hypothetical protein
MIRRSGSNPPGRQSPRRAGSAGPSRFAGRRRTPRPVLPASWGPLAGEALRTNIVPGVPGSLVGAGPRSRALKRGAGHGRRHILGRVAAALGTIAVWAAARLAGAGPVAGMSPYGRGAGRLGRFLRRAQHDRNPLRRRLDRVQAVLRAGLLAVFVIGGPIATACVSHEAYVAGLRAEQAQTAMSHRVPAIVLHTVSAEAAAWRHPAQPAVLLVEWLAPGGQLRTGKIMHSTSLAPDSTVTVWVGAHGRLTRAPLTHADVVVHVIGAAILTPLLLALALCTVGGAASLVLDRRRLAAWEADWLVVEPQWTRRE